MCLSHKPNESSEYFEKHFTDEIGKLEATVQLIGSSTLCIGIYLAYNYLMCIKRCLLIYWLIRGSLSYLSLLAGDLLGGLLLGRSLLLGGLLGGSLLGWLGRSWLGGSSWSSGGGNSGNDLGDNLLGDDLLYGLLDCLLGRCL